MEKILSLEYYLENPKLFYLAKNIYKKVDPVRVSYYLRMINQGNYKILDYLKDFDDFFLNEKILKKCPDRSFALWLLDAGIFGQRILAFHMAYHGHFDLLKPLKDYNHRAVKAAVKNNRLEILKWFMQKTFINYSEVSTVAAKYEKIEILEYLYRESKVLMFDVYLSAINNGRMKIITWLLGKNYHIIYCSHQAMKYSEEFFWQIYNYDATLSFKIFNQAVKKGNIKLLEKLLDLGCPCDDTAFLTAGKHGHTHILEFLKQKHWSPLNNLCDIAVKYNQKEVLLWALENNCPFNSYTIDLTGGDRELLSLLPGDYSNKIFYYAAIKGNLDFFERSIISKIIKENPLIMAEAVNHFHLFSWLLDHNFSWDERAFYNAAKTSNLNIMKILYAKDKVRCCPEKVLDICLIKGNLEILRWLKSIKISKRVYYHDNLKIQRMMVNIPSEQIDIDCCFFM